MIGTQEPSRLRWSAKALLLLFLWVVLPLLTVEFAMIVLEPYLFTGFYQYDPDIGFRVRPYAMGSNQFGFNDKDYPLQRAPGTFRILVVGDSFGWAGGKDGNYTALLGKQLSTGSDGHRIEVINASYPNTHTGEQLLVLKKYGLQYDPHLVVLGFFAGNDFADAVPNRKRIVVNDIYIDIDKRQEVTLFGYPLVRHSRLLLFVKQKYRILRETLGTPLMGHAQQQSPSQGTFSEDTFLSIERDRMEFCNLKAYRQGKDAGNVDYIFQSVREMRNLLQAKGIPLIVAIFPDEFQINEQLADTIFRRFNLDRDDYDLALMQKVLKTFLDSEKIPYVDMLERFREAGRRESLYLLRDSHWNEAGNHLAADILRERLSGIVQTYFNSGATSLQ
jgi:SGNH hydrolase-like domain, acetyltransferase AlgX